MQIHIIISEKNLSAFDDKFRIKLQPLE